MVGTRVTGSVAMTIYRTAMETMRDRSLDLLPNKNLWRDSVAISEYVCPLLMLPLRCVVLDRGQQPATVTHRFDDQRSGSVGQVGGDPAVAIERARSRRHR